MDGHPSLMIVTSPEEDAESGSATDPDAFASFVFRLRLQTLCRVPAPRDVRDLLCHVGCWVRRRVTVGESDPYKIRPILRSFPRCLMMMGGFSKWGRNRNNNLEEVVLCDLSCLSLLTDLRNHCTPTGIIVYKRRLPTKYWSCRRGTLNPLCKHLRFPRRTRSRSESFFSSFTFNKESWSVCSCTQPRGF